MNSFNQFSSESDACVKEFNSFIGKHSLQEVTSPDHICYKCDSEECFESLRKMLESASAFIFQSIISKRRIAIVKFKKQIETVIGPIWYLELSDQKPDGSQKNGFDHVEIYPASISYDNLVQKIEAGGEKMEKVERPHHTTHDITLASGFGIKLTKGPLIEKIKKEEMV